MRRRIQYLYSTCIWLEGLGWVLCGDPALKGATLDMHLLLGQIQIREGMAIRYPYLGLDQVDPRIGKKDK